jgi:hypothetical protein
MAEDTSREPQDQDHTDESSWFKRIHISDIIVFLQLLLGLTASLNEEVSEEAGHLAKSGLNLARSFKDWAFGLLRHPLLVWTFRLYFFLLPLLALIFLVFGFKTLAYSLALAQLALIILTTYALSVFIRHGKGSGFFFRIVIFVSTLEFIVISILNFFVILPADLFNPLQYVTLIGLLVAMIPLSVIVQTRWTWGWIVIFILSSLPLIAYVFVPEGAMRGWVGERHAWQAYSRVVITEPLRIYTEDGDATGRILPLGDTLYVDFNRKIKVADHLYAFACYPNFVGDHEIYLPLIRESNYYHLTPAPPRDVIEKVVEIKTNPADTSERADMLRDTTRISP